MARARNIKPAFFSNELLAELQAFDRLLFAGLWCLADREGRIDDRPKRIKMELFPCDSYDVESGLNALCESGFVRRYQVEGFSVIAIEKFHKHQSPHGSEKDSILPDQDGYLTVNERAKGVVVTGKSKKVHVNPPLINVNPSLENALIPDSPNPVSLNPGSLKNQKPSSPSGDGKPVKPDPLQGFAEFWIKYPRKTAKQDAEKAWARLKPSVELQSTLITAVDQQAKSLDWTKDGGKFIPHPATWLNGKRWEDQLTDAPLSKHGDFDKRDYYAGLTQREDGTYAF